MRVPSLRMYQKGDIFSIAVYKNDVQIGEGKTADLEEALALFEVLARLQFRKSDQTAVEVLAEWCPRT